MPKAARSRISRAHAPAPNSTKRKFAQADATPSETVLIGSAPGASADELLSSFSNEASSPNKPPKPEPAPTLDPSSRRDQRLASRLLEHARRSGEAPYSRSHRKRLNRKAREQVTGTGMASVGEAIEEVGRMNEVEEQRAGRIGKETASGEMLDGRRRKKAPAPATGKKALTDSQRAAILKTETARLPSVLKHPSFASNPFETIRTHALNTLTMLEPPR